jgi:hypothetical protein
VCVCDGARLPASQGGNSGILNVAAMMTFTSCTETPETGQLGDSGTELGSATHT